MRAQRRGIVQAVEGELEGGIVPQGAGIVAVLVAGCDHQQAKADDLDVA